MPFISATSQTGQVVTVHERHYFVEEMTSAPNPRDTDLVRPPWLDDDTHGQQLQELWKTKFDAEIIIGRVWECIAIHDFDPVRPKNSAQLQVSVAARLGV